jgi:hypothetical protein
MLWRARSSNSHGSTYDPTSWFYDAILKQSINRPVEALDDLQKSIELNDNRAVYRSDCCWTRSCIRVRSPIYSDRVRQAVSLTEAYASPNGDPTNHSPTACRNLRWP